MSTNKAVFGPETWDFLREGEVPYRIQKRLCRPVDVLGFDPEADSELALSRNSTSS